MNRTPRLPIAPVSRLSLPRALPVALALAVALLGPPPSGASPTVAEQAGAAFLAQEWSKALPLYEQLVKEEPKNGQYLIRLGVTQLSLGKGADGLASIQKAKEAGAPPQIADYRLACAYAVLGKSEEALASLDAAVKGGFASLALIQTDPLLESIRSAPEFAASVATLEKALFPCKHDPKFREFDFWVGEWDVVPAGAAPGFPPAENIVTLEHGDCIVHEHWKGTTTGESFNLWDASKGAWFQTWVDSTGGMHEYKGALDKDGNMAYTAELAPSPGQATNENGRVPTRLTFFNMGPDKVRQLSEQTTDGGKTWTTSYDLIYTRRKPAAGN